MSIAWILGSLCNSVLSEVNQSNYDLMPDQAMCQSSQRINYYAYFLVSLVSRNTARYQTLYIPVYVDDQLMACNSHPHLDKVKAELSQHFKMKDMGPTKYIVRLEIHWDRVHRTLHLNQHKYTLDMLKWFNMEDCNPVSTPLVMCLHLYFSHYSPIEFGPDILSMVF